MNSESDTKLRAGFASVDITPTALLPMGGYINRTGRARGVHDPLHAKAAVFRRGANSVVLLSLDILFVTREWACDVREAISNALGAPPGHILVAATHTHSGPAIFSPLTERSSELVRHEQTLLEKCVEAADRACKSTEESMIRVGRALSRGIAQNRRRPSETTESPVSVIRVENRSGKALGHIASFACHATVMSASNLEYSADLHGAAAGYVEENFEDSVCVMFNGAGGDTSTRFTRTEQTWRELERMGRSLAGCVSEASRNSVAIRDNPISARSVTREFAFRDVPDIEESQSQFDKASADFRNAVDSGSAESASLARSMVEGAAARLYLSRTGGWKRLFASERARVEIQAIRVGDLMVCGLPGEFFAAREERLRRAAEPGVGLVIGYANGYWGYLLPPEEAEKGGYERLMSPLHPEDEPAILSEAENLIKEMKEGVSPE